MHFVRFFLGVSAFFPVFTTCLGGGEEERKVAKEQRRQEKTTGARVLVEAYENEGEGGSNLRGNLSLRDELDSSTRESSLASLRPSWRPCVLPLPPCVKRAGHVPQWCASRDHQEEMGPKAREACTPKRGMILLRPLRLCVLFASLLAAHTVRVLPVRVRPQELVMSLRSHIRRLEGGDSRDGSSYVNALAGEGQAIHRAVA